MYIIADMVIEKDKIYIYIYIYTCTYTYIYIPNNSAAEKSKGL